MVLGDDWVLFLLGILGGGRKFSDNVEHDCDFFGRFIGDTDHSRPGYIDHAAYFRG